MSPKTQVHPIDLHVLLGVWCLQGGFSNIRNHNLHSRPKGRKRLTIYFSYDLRNLSWKTPSRIPLMSYWPGEHNMSHPNEFTVKEHKIGMFYLDKSKFTTTTPPGLVWGHSYVVHKILWKHIDVWAKMGELTKERWGVANCWGKFSTSLPHLCLTSEHKALIALFIPF